MNKRLLLLGLAVLNGCAWYSVEPGNRGVLIRMGQVSQTPLPEGWGAKLPLLSTIVEVSVRQTAGQVDAACFSSDLQQVRTQLTVLYRIPEASVVKVFREYAGGPFDALVAPRVQEALKEATAVMTAEQIAKQREAVKAKTLEAARRKVGELLAIEDIVIVNIDLSDELEHAIEAKMVQEQEAAKAKFTQQKAEIEAQTAVVRARGEAEAIRIRGQALKETPRLIDLQIVEKWDGKAPLYVGSGGGNMLLPMAQGR